MNNKFLNKVCDQIISETRIIDDRIYTPFSFFSLPTKYFIIINHNNISRYFFFFKLDISSHCKDVYSLNKEETKYVWDKYKEEVTTLIGKKELVC